MLFGQNLNTDFVDSGHHNKGIYWESFGGRRNSYRNVEMAIRPVNFETLSKLFVYSFEKSLV